MKALILFLSLLPWALGGPVLGIEPVVGIGNGLSVGANGGGVYFSPPGSGVSVGVNGGGIYISPPGSHVSIPIDPPARRGGRNNNVVPDNFQLRPIWAMDTT